MTPLLLLVLALIISATATHLLVRASAHAKAGFMDQPDERKVHDHPIPRTGGIAVFTGALATMLSQLGQDSLLAGYAVGATILVVFCILDDYRGLDFRLKFLGQVLASVAMLAISGVGIHSLGELLPGVTVDLGPLWPVATVFFLLTVINAVNFSDGLDGLAGGISLLILSCVALMAFFIENTSVLIISLCTVGGIIGFLRLNVHPAIIFMGDTGSQFLGFTLGVCLMALTQRESIFSPVLPLFLMGTPLLDLVLVVFQRLTKHQSIFRPDKNHLHHKLLANGLDHAQAVTLIHMANLGLLALGYSLRYTRDFILCGVYLALVGALLATVLGVRTSFGLRQRLQRMLSTGFATLMMAGTTPIYGAPSLSRAAWALFLAAFGVLFLFLPAMAVGLTRIHGAGFLAAALIGIALYRSNSRLFAPLLRLTAYAVLLVAVITHAGANIPDALVSQAGRILFVALGISYAAFVVISRDRLLPDGMDSLLIAIAVLALFAPVSDQFPAAQMVLAKTLLGGLCINLMMNRAEKGRRPLALLCLGSCLAFFVRSML